VTSGLGATIWIESGGGPLVVLEGRLLDAWQGTGLHWDPGSGSDYDRACEVTDWVGVLAVRDGQALILGADPTPTCIREAPSGVLLVRWIHAPQGWRPPDARDLLGESWSEPLAWLVGDSRQVIQDSAYPGGDGSTEQLVMSLAPGRYLVETAEYSPDPEVRMILHRISR